MRASISLIDAVRPNLHLVIAIGALAVAGVCAQAAELEEVTVAAPTVKTLGHDAYGVPIQQVSATVHVRYNRIMLTTNSGRALLDDKVAEVARKLCTPGDTVGSDENCVRQAIKGAKSQLDAAAARVKGQ